MHVRSCKMVSRRMRAAILELSTPAQRSRSATGSTLPFRESNLTGSTGDRWKPGRTNRAPEAMVRSVEGMGGLRGIIQFPPDRASEHGLRLPSSQADGSPRKNDELKKDEYLQQARKKQFENITSTEHAVGLIPGESLMASTTESVITTGNKNETEKQKEIAGEFTRTESRHDPCFDQHETHKNLQVDEEVKRGLIADSEHPMGRVPKDTKDVIAEKSDDWDEEHGRIQMDIAEHGPFKSV